MRPDGTAKFARFRKLNASSLICAVRFAGSATTLISDKSELISPGPVSVFRSRLPRVPLAGSANALMSQYRSGPPRIGLLEKLVVFRFPVRLKPRRTVNGCPVCSVVTLLSCQPFSTPAASPVNDAGAGTSQLQLNVRLCRAWNADGPRSYVGSYQSRPYCTLLSKSCELMPLESSVDFASVYDTCARSPCE